MRRASLDRIALLRLEPFPHPPPPNQGVARPGYLPDSRAVPAGCMTGRDDRRDHRPQHIERQRPDRSRITVSRDHRDDSPVADP